MSTTNWSASFLLVTLPYARAGISTASCARSRSRAAPRRASSPGHPQQSTHLEGIDMTPGIFSARVIAPIHFIAAGGRAQTIPLGPCLIEAHDSQCAVVDIVWGASGEEST